MFSKIGKLTETILQARAGIIILHVVLLSIVLGSFYVLCRLFPICSDDYGNHFMYEYGAGTISWLPERIITLADVFRSTLSYYYSWGGRIMAGLIFQTLLMFDKWVYDCLNVFVYLTLVVSVCRLSKALSWRSILIVALSFWLMMPAPGSSLIWLTGSINYLWMSALVCAFLCCQFSNNRLIQVVGLILAIPAGNSHEGISSAVLVALILFLLLDRRRRGTFFYISLLLFFVGFLSNIMAPGTAVRMGTSEIEGRSIMCKIGEAYLRSAHARGYLLQWGWKGWMILIWAPLTLAFSTWGLRGLERSQKRLAQALSIGAILCSLLVIFASGSTYTRAYFGSAFVGYIGLAITLLPSIDKLKGFSYSVMLAILVGVNISSYCEAYRQISLMGHYEMAIRTLSMKDPIVIVPEKYRGKVGGRYTEMYGKFPDILHPSSKALACYLGVSEVAVFSKEDEIQMVENSANFDGLGVGESRNIGKDSYLLRLASRPAKVKGRRLVVPPPTQLDGFWGIILNEALRARVSDHVGATAFCREGLYYALIKVQDDTEIEVRYENGNEARYTVVPQ
ncbi:MAG: DUF6056 family protein [Akkermansia muciniphila]|nr:DUF6056 family protein [Akkermansia muciniphila]